MTTQVTAMLISTTGIGFLMAWSGIQKNMLEWRRRRRYCPCCGRVIDGRRCACSS